MVSGRTLALNENHRAAVLHVVELNIKASVFAYIYASAESRIVPDLAHQK